MLYIELESFLNRVEGRFQAYAISEQPLCKKKYETQRGSGRANLEIAQEQENPLLSPRKDACTL